MKEKRSLHYLIALAGILIGVCLDQFTKYLAVLHLKGQAPLVLIDGVFQLEYLENRGAAFGLFQGQRMFFFSERRCDPGDRSLVLSASPHGTAVSCPSYSGCADRGRRYWQFY